MNQTWDFKTCCAIPGYGYAMADNDAKEIKVLYKGYLKTIHFSTKVQQMCHLRDDIFVVAYDINIGVFAYNKDSREYDEIYGDFFEQTTPLFHTHNPDESYFLAGKHLFALEKHRGEDRVRFLRDISLFSRNFVRCMWRTVGNNSYLYFQTNDGLRRMDLCCVEDPMEAIQLSKMYKGFDNTTCKVKKHLNFGNKHYAILCDNRELRYYHDKNVVRTFVEVDDVYQGPETSEMVFRRCNTLFNKSGTPLFLDKKEFSSFKSLQKAFFWDDQTRLVFDDGRIINPLNLLDKEEEEEEVPPKEEEVPLPPKDFELSSAWLRGIRDENKKLKLDLEELGEKKKKRGEKLAEDTKELERQYNEDMENFELEEVKIKSRMEEVDGIVELLKDFASKELGPTACPVCLVAKKDTHSDDCGHLMCNNCYTTIYESNKNECPICKTSLSSTRHQVFD